MNADRHCRNLASEKQNRPTPISLLKTTMARSGKERDFNVSRAHRALYKAQERTDATGRRG